VNLAEHRVKIEHIVATGITEDRVWEAKSKVLSAEKALAAVEEEAERKEMEGRVRMGHARERYVAVVERLREFGMVVGSRDFPIVLE